MIVQVADVLGAHARLAAIDPASSEEALTDSLLQALLLGAGVPSGVLVVPSTGTVATHGVTVPAKTLAPLTFHLRSACESGSALTQAVLADALAAVFADASERSVDPRAIPLTAEDETLALMLLAAPPGDPVGFASVTAHAASLFAMVRMSHRVREADFELKYRVWELQSLYDVGLSIAGTLDMESLADDILMKSVSLLNARKGMLIVRDLVGDGQVLVKDFGGLLLEDFGGLEDALFSSDDDVFVANRLTLPEGESRSLAGAEGPSSNRLTLPEGESRSLAGAEGPSSGRDEPRHGAARFATAAAEKILAVPICSDGKRLGILIVADKENRAGGVDDFNRDTDGRILKLFGNQAAIALENARLHREAVEKERMEREIELAATIQKTILPESIPSVPGLLLAGGNRPTRQVGGDYFDVFPLADGRTAFCVADVSGKGVPAALLVSTVHACLHLLVDAFASDLKGLVARINRHLVKFSATRKFVTLFFAVYDPTTRELNYVNAGHNPAFWLSRDKTELLPSGGVPIGMLPNVVHRDDRIVLSPGDLVILYSDGITEAMDSLDEEFGMDRLSALLRDGVNETPSELTTRIFGEVAAFTRGVAQYDDQTVLATRVL